MTDKIQRVLTERWSISDTAYQSLLLSLLSALKAGNLAAVEQQLGQNPVTAYALNPSHPNVVSRWDLGDPEMPRDSILVLQLEGTLYSWDTYMLEQKLQQAMDDEKIAGVVLWINGPGGMVSHVDLAAKAIEQSPKPIATYVAGSMCSAHFWVGTAAQRIFLASPMCEVGSVGVMTQYYDPSGYFKELGIDSRDIYPDSADLKNYEWRQIHDKDNEGPLKERLARVHQMFCQDVERHLGVKYDPDLELYRGKTFDGQTAIELGYAHQLGTLEDAVMWVFTRAMVARTR